MKDTIFDMLIFLCVFLVIGAAITCCAGCTQQEVADTAQKISEVVPELGRAAGDVGDVVGPATGTNWWQVGEVGSYVVGGIAAAVAAALGGNKLRKRGAS